MCAGKFVGLVSISHDGWSVWMCSAIRLIIHNLVHTSHDVGMFINIKQLCTDPKLFHWQSPAVRGTNPDLRFTGVLTGH